MPEDGGLIGQVLICLKPVNAWVHTYTKPQISSTRSRILGWRIHESVEDTKLSTNKQHSLSKSPAAPIITTDTLRVNKSLLIGKKLKKYFAGFGGAIGTVTDYLLDHDAYRLEYTDGHVDIIPFDDILKPQRTLFVH